MKIISVTKKPASGPEAPISKSAFRFGIGDLILITAPIVPNGFSKKGGIGM